MTGTQSALRKDSFCENHVNLLYSCCRIQPTEPPEVKDEPQETPVEIQTRKRKRVSIVGDVAEIDAPKAKRSSTTAIVKPSKLSSTSETPLESELEPEVVKPSARKSQKEVGYFSYIMLSILMLHYMILIVLYR